MKASTDFLQSQISNASKNLSRNRQAVKHDFELLPASVRQHPMDIHMELLITPAEGLAQRLSGAQQYSSTSTGREKDPSYPRSHLPPGAGQVGWQAAGYVLCCSRKPVCGW